LAIKAVKQIVIIAVYMTCVTDTSSETSVQPIGNENLFPLRLSVRALLFILLLAALFLYAYHYNSPERVATFRDRYTAPKVMPNE
jgi:hypothetical protein